MAPDFSEFRTDSINLASYLNACARYHRRITQDAGKRTATFHFDRDPELLRLVAEFASGEAMVNAVAVLNARAKLFREIKEGRRHE